MNLKTKIGAVGDSDSVRIVQAMEYGISRLGQPHRGKGFADIRYPVLLDARNELRIFSRNGRYTEKGGMRVASDGLATFGGTLIDWHLHVPESVIPIQS